MKMLILKKKIVFINIKKRYNIVTIRIKLFYYFIKKKLMLLVFLSNCLLKKRSIIVTDLKYFYTLKWKCTSPFMLHNKLNSLIEFFYNVKNLGHIKSFNHLSNSKYFVSVIRSPFVYKKSMEQFFYKRYKIYYQTNVLSYNFFFHNYQYVLLKKKLREKAILKLFCKITFIFN
jgi:hypothetical protein